MNDTASSCELPSERPVSSATSRVMRFQQGFRWEGVPVAEYKAPGDHWCGIVRMLLVGGRGEGVSFHVRYFEIAPGGFSSLEHHAHEHVVIVLRGRGEVQLGYVNYPLGFGDAVYVAPHEVHQFRTPAAATEPLGFLCIVDVVRDLPAPPQK